MDDELTAMARIEAEKYASPQWNGKR